VTPRAGQTIVFSADPGVILDPPTPLWDFGNGDHRAGNPLTYTYSIPGTYDIVFTASESACRTTQVTSPVHIGILPESSCVPEPELPRLCCHNRTCDPGDDEVCPEDCAPDGFTVAIDGPTTTRPGIAEVFRPIVTTNPGEAVSAYHWNFGDGNTSSDATPQHAYETAGTYIVTLDVATNLDAGTATASTIVEAGSSSPSPEPLNCDRCEHIDYLRWNPFFGHIEARAALFTDPATVEGEANSTAVQAEIRDPRGAVVFSSGIVEEVPVTYEAEVDFRAFHLDPRARQPIPGRWTLRIAYYFRERGGRRTLYLIGRVEDPLEIGPCANQQVCGVQPGEARVNDGRFVDIQLTNPDPTKTYTWTSELTHITEGVVGNFPPDARLNPPTGSATRSTPKWVALPNLQCAPGGYSGAYTQAIVNSEYAVFPTANGQVSDPFSRVAVQVPWGILAEYSVEGRGADGPVRGAGLTANPTTDVQFGAELCDVNVCRTDPAALHNFVRAAGDIRYAPGIEISQFFSKVSTHERDHQDFDTNPNRCGSRYWTFAGLQDHFTRCAQDTGPTGCAVPVINGDIAAARIAVRARQELNLVTWQVNEAVAYGQDLTFLLSEKEAWRAADDVPPAFIYESCNVANVYHWDRINACPR